MMSPTAMTKAHAAIMAQLLFALQRNRVLPEHEVDTVMKVARDSITANAASTEKAARDYVDLLWNGLVADRK
jgi:hypothetical protein